MCNSIYWKKSALLTGTASSLRLWVRWGWSQNHQDGPNGVHQTNMDSDLAMWKEGSIQKWHVCPYSYHPEATQFSLPLYLAPPEPHPPFATDPGKCLWGSESSCELFKRVPGFPVAFHLTWMNGIPADFLSLILWGLLTLSLWAGELGVGLALQEGPLQLRYPLDSQLPYVDVGPAHFAYLCLWPVWR